MADYPVTPLTPPLSEQEIIRRQKLQKLLDAGQNPYEITRLQATIRTATIVADDEITTERVSIGTIVKVKDLDDGETYEYAIVGANEADPMEDKISNESPVGAGLIGMKKGQTVEITIPAGILRYKIMSIKKM